MGEAGGLPARPFHSKTAESFTLHHLPLTIFQQQKKGESEKRSLGLVMQGFLWSCTSFWGHKKKQKESLVGDCTTKFDLKEEKKGKKDY